MKKASDSVRGLFSSSTVYKSTESLSSEESYHSSTAEETLDSLNQEMSATSYQNREKKPTSSIPNEENAPFPESQEEPSAEKEMPATSSQNREKKPTSSIPNEENATAPDYQEKPSAEKARDNHLIDAYNQLRTKTSACGYNLDSNMPKIAVVGAENTGKTSVLQSFVGEDFLPRGQGIVTRRPIVIQLEPLPKGSKEYGTFAHMPKGDGNTEMKIYDFAAIRQEIVDETNRLLGPNDFSSVPIDLKIYSPHVLKLTLVDLPGIVENEVDDQDESVVSTVYQMVRENIADPGTIMLAICPANQPISTSVALKICKEVDPNRERTIGVLTKLDLEEAGTNSLDVVENRKKPLQRGYVGVVNRNHTDIRNGRDIADERAYEKRFFQNSCYSHIAHKMGSEYLQELLHKTLKQHIQRQLPSIREDLSLRLSRMQRELKAFNETLGEGVDGESNFYLMNYVYDFVNNVNIDLMGYSDEVPDSYFTTGAELNALLNFEAKKFLGVDTTPDEMDLTRVMANVCGIRNSISLPSLSMNACCRKLVNRFIDPLERSLLTIRDVLLDSVLEQTSCMDRYPFLKNEVIRRIKIKVAQLTDETRDKLVDHCMAEKSSVNVGHPDYDIDKCSAIAPQAGFTKVWEKISKSCQPPLAETATPRASNSTVVKEAVPTVQDAVRMPPSATNGAQFAAGPSSRDDKLMTLLLQDECNKKRTQFVSQMITNYLEIVKKNVLHVYFIQIKYSLVFKFMNYLNKKLTIELGNNWASDLKKTLAQDCEEDFKKKAAMEAECKYLEEALALIKAF